MSSAVENRPCHYPAPGFSLHRLFKMDSSPGVKHVSKVGCHPYKTGSAPEEEGGGAGLPLGLREGSWSRQVTADRLGLGTLRWCLICKLCGVRVLTSCVRPTAGSPSSAVQTSEGHTRVARLS